jgi:cephalosporin-C deacetylase-like acetyl esterase
MILLTALSQLKKDIKSYSRLEVERNISICHQDTIMTLACFDIQQLAISIKVSVKIMICGFKIYAQPEYRRIKHVTFSNN